MAIRVTKRTQHCTFCKNHGLSTPKKGHHCPYLNCPCLLCKLTKKAQMAMRHQQRVWRHQKQKLKSQKLGIEDASDGAENKPNKSQACDKCRNHNILRLKRNHQCPFINCQCEYCSLTFKRREIMKHQQRVRRSRIMTQIESDAASKLSGEKLEEDGKEYIYFRNEELPNNPPNRYTDDEKGVEDEEVLRDERPTHSSFINGRSEKEMAAIPMKNMENLSLRSAPGEVEHFQHHTPLPHQLENNVLPAYEPGEETGESPPPLIHVVPNRPSSPPFYPRTNRSVSPQSHFDNSSREDSSPHVEVDSSPPRFDPFHDESKEKSHQRSPPPLMLFQRANSSSSFRSFSFPPSQPLQSLSALNASLEPSVNSFKFGTQIEDFHLRNNRNWLPSTLIGSSFGNFSQSTALLLQQPQQQQPQLHRPHLQQLVRPMPLNMSRPRPPPSGVFPQHFWNHMFLPFGLGLHHQNSSEPNLERFHGIEGSSRFSSMDIFHPA